MTDANWENPRRFIYKTAPVYRAPADIGCSRMNVGLRSAVGKQEVGKE